MEALGREQRREVVQLLKRDREHPDPAVRAVAYAWGHSPRWEGWSYRLPGWLLPWAGLVVLVVGVEVGQLALVALGAVITGWGAIRWNNLACARAIRRVYAPPT
jgi:hypothetical protein